MLPVSPNITLMITVYVMVMTYLGLGLLMLRRRPDRPWVPARRLAPVEARHGWLALVRQVVGAAVGGYALLMTVALGYYQGVAHLGGRFLLSAATGTLLLTGSPCPSSSSPHGSPHADAVKADTGCTLPRRVQGTCRFTKPRNRPTVLRPAWAGVRACGWHCTKQLSTRFTPSWSSPSVIVSTRSCSSSSSWRGMLGAAPSRRAVGPTAATVNCLEFSPDGALLATGCEDARVRVHSAEDWVPRHEQAHDLPVWAMAFASDGSTLAVGTNRGAVTLWALRGSRPGRRRPSSTRSEPRRSSGPRQAAGSPATLGPAHSRVRPRSPARPRRRPRHARRRATGTPGPAAQAGPSASAAKSRAGRAAPPG
ncbi:DUF6256 family protein [Streptomyces sp. NPDC001549]|uniref:DUF6256 family protein n=1 Tax=Streptomyces sp. NPDC001549 TaxID=3364586 RepID=UPI0036CDAFB7